MEVPRDRQPASWLDDPIQWLAGMRPEKSAACDPRRSSGDPAEGNLTAAQLAIEARRTTGQNRKRARVWLRGASPLIRSQIRKLPFSLQKGGIHVFSKIAPISSGMCNLNGGRLPVAGKLPGSIQKLPGCESEVRRSLPETIVGFETGASRWTAHAAG